MLSLFPRWFLCLTGKLRLKLLPDESCEGGRLSSLHPSKEPMGLYDEAHGVPRGPTRSLGRCQAGRPLVTLCEHLISSLDLFAVHTRPGKELRSCGCEGPRARSLVGRPCDVVKSLLGPELELYPEAVELPEALEEGRCLSLS